MKDLVSASDDGAVHDIELSKESLTSSNKSRSSVVHSPSLCMSHVAQMPASPGWILGAVPLVESSFFRGTTHCLDCFGTWRTLLSVNEVTVIWLVPENIGIAHIYFGFLARTFPWARLRLSLCTAAVHDSLK